METFCRLLPKAELHAHINGSCSEETIGKLIALKQSKDKSWRPSGQLDLGKSKQTLEECFEQFRLLHELCDSEEAAHIVTSDVIHEFAADNVKYLELRTTPRDVAATRMTKSSYIASVVDAIKKSVADHEIIVRLLLAIDRRMTLNDMEETLKIVESYVAETNSIVVGLDLSGNPKAGKVDDFLPIFRRAKQQGLKLSFHLAEIKSVLHETDALLSAGPDRIGHGTFLIPELAGSPDLANKVLDAKLPIELCLSSNVQTRTVSDFESHHFDFWYKKRHPCVICTDDKGVFATSLTKEFTIAANTFQLTTEDVWNLSYDSINWIFSDDGVKEQLRTKWDKLKPICFAQCGNDTL
jgi:adenosine deaminase